jgi:hypothetical protein
LRAGHNERDALRFRLVRFEFRPSNPGDAAVIAELCERVLAVPERSPVFSPQHMQWKYWDPWPTWHGSRSFLLFDRERAIAHAAVVPLRFSRESKPHTLVQLIDWAAEPSHVGAGVSLLKRIAALADGAVSVRGSAMTQRILKPVGFRSLGETVRYAVPRSSAVRLNFNSELARASKLRIHERGSFAPFEHPLSEAQSSADQIIFQRSASQVKIWLGCPVAPMRYVEVLHESRLIGSFVLCHAPQQARIVDVWADAELEGAWEAVIDHAYVQGCEQTDATEVVCQTNDPAQARALQARGFTDVGSDPLAILASLELVPNGSFVRHHLLDSDLAYLHHGDCLSWLR